MTRRRFGQHFLRDADVIKKIIAAVAPARGGRIIEIGAGDGALTSALMSCGAHLTLVEIDRDLAPPLREKFPAAHLISEDILRCDWRALLAGKPRIVGNLPYNISAPLLLKMAENSGWRDAHIMVQKEVGDRLCAGAGGGDYGRLTVKARLAYDSETLFTVPAAAFAPPPKVLSSFLRLTPAAALLPPPHFDALLRDAFAQRRKTLANALRAWRIDWRAAGIDGALRAQALTPRDFLRLAAAARSDKIKP